MLTTLVTPSYPLSSVHFFKSRWKADELTKPVVIYVITHSQKSSFLEVNMNHSLVTTHGLEGFLWTVSLLPPFESLDMCDWPKLGPCDRCHYEYLCSNNLGCGSLG